MAGFKDKEGGGRGMKIKIGCVGFILIVYIVMWGLFAWLNPYDDTDDIKNKKRSGLTLYTDYKTGVQYIGRWGSLCPRIDKDGNIMTIEEEEK